MKMIPNKYWKYVDAVLEFKLVDQIIVVIGLGKG
jgi:hypothetical protein